MTKLTRRDFIRAASLGGLAVLSGIPAASWGANANVVIVGGGTGGATAAKYLKLADPSINITLVEKNPKYYTCYMSNEVLGGERDLESLSFDYEGLKKRGINVVHDTVTNIDAKSRTVALASGNSLVYDRCIVSPGIDFRYDAIEGYSEDVIDQIPHAWKAGSQTTVLQQQLQAMPDNGTFVLVAPPNPYRCPPAPYERASQVAHYFKKHKPNAKVIILDPKDKFAKQGAFIQSWEKLYNYGTPETMIDWQPLRAVSSVDVATKTVTTTDADNNTIKADVLNIIPPQKAGKIAFDAGLVDDSGWCPVHLSSFESKIHKNIHVIGDASIASPLPKSGFAANSEAKACALAVAALLNNREPGHTSFTNGCYSLVGEDYAISVVAVYRLSADGVSIQKVEGAGGTTPADATEDQLMVDVDYAYSWYNNFTHDIFK